MGKVCFNLQGQEASVVRGVEGTAGREGSRGLRCTLQSQSQMLAMIAQQLLQSLRVPLNLIAACLP